MQKPAILFVCLGNICRSPLAQGVFEHLLQERGLRDDFIVDSCGTGGWHVGEPPHPGTQEVADKNGISLDGQVSRKLRANDFDKFTHIVAMDADNLSVLKRNKGNSSAEIFLLRDYDERGRGLGVPDPFYLGGFEEVFKMVYRSCSALLDDLISQQK